MKRGARVRSHLVMPQDLVEEEEKDRPAQGNGEIGEEVCRPMCGGSEDESGEDADESGLCWWALIKPVSVAYNHRLAAA